MHLSAAKGTNTCLASSKAIYSYLLDIAQNSGGRTGVGSRPQLCQFLDGYGIWRHDLAKARNAGGERQHRGFLMAVVSHEEPHGASRCRGSLPVATQQEKAVAMVA